jgi:hypothetical protein
MLASGRPSIAMTETGTGIALEMEGTGLVIPPGDTGALTAALIALAKDGALRARLGAAARARAKQRWDRDAIIRSLELEFLMLPRRQTAKGLRLRQPAHAARSIDQVTTGTRRGIELPNLRSPVHQARRHIGSTGPSQE